LDLFKINTILRYLERSKRLEIDLDGNIIWTRQDSDNNQLSLAERANISKEFLDLYSKKKENPYQGGKNVSMHREHERNELINSLIIV
jgi:hypothetical protein